GRSFLSPQVALHVANTASSYCNLEYDLNEGQRGSRHSHLESLLTRLTGCEAALVVNNNAAAVLLILSALFKGKEIIVSRGEEVEIGGAFRIPDIIEEGGGILRAVGTTNRTRLSDYAKAIVPELTGGLLKVHTSNYRIVGYTEETSISELATLAKAQNLPLICDLGSGTFFDLSPIGLDDEPTINQIILDGADLLCFSGDKMLGGVQAGVIVGSRKYVEKLKNHPLARALRVDKLTISALEATLRLYLDPSEAKGAIPTVAMLFATPKELGEKAETLAQKIKNVPNILGEIVDCQSQAGGGAAPECPLESKAVAVSCLHLSATELASSLRSHEKPIIARIFQERLLFDVRTLNEWDFDEIVKALTSVGGRI
ncbi:MAG: L-seryl-tRNA(Sec) selenium transferase, partial [Candidatus Adiutrix sp.]